MYTIYSVLIVFSLLNTSSKGCNIASLTSPLQNWTNRRKRLQSADIIVIYILFNLDLNYNTKVSVETIEKLRLLEWEKG